MSVRTRIGNALRALRGGANGSHADPYTLTFAGESWPSKTDSRVDWNHDGIASLQAARLAQFAAHIESGAALGLSLEAEPPFGADAAAHNTVMTFAYVLGAASQNKSSLRILDWGGGVGQYALLARVLFPRLEIDYTVCDLPATVEIAAKKVSNIEFISSEQPLSGSFDLVMSSGALQYVADWRSVVSQLAERARDYLFITRLAVVQDALSYVTVQHSHANGVSLSYPGWALNQGELVSSVESHGLSRVREFIVSEQTPVSGGAPEQPRYKGFLFAR